MCQNTVRLVGLGHKKSIKSINTLTGVYTMGGYRKGSGRSKSGYYKGIYCGSTYELCWVIYHLDHNVKFTRFSGKLEYNGIRYYPDFLLGDGKTIIETKGYESQESVDRKKAVAEYHGFTVKVLRKKDLEFAFLYVKETYGTSKYYELYDGYEPKYKHICDCCKTEFETDRKITTTTKFCSRICAGRYRKSMYQMTEKIKQKISQSLIGRKVKSLIGRKVKSYKRKYKQIWITNGKINTRIKEGNPIPEGFKQGRTVTL